MSRAVHVQAVTHKLRACVFTQFRVRGIRVCENQIIRLDFASLTIARGSTLAAISGVYCNKSTPTTG